MFGPILKVVPKLIPVVIEPLVSLLLEEVKARKGQHLANVGVVYGMRYARAYMANDQEEMKKIHMDALLSAKYRGMDKAREAAEKRQ